MEELIEFLNVQHGNLEANLKSREVQDLFSPVHNAYEIAIKALPPETDLAVRKLLLLCQRSSMVAVGLIATGNPDDSVPVTRRTIEMARLAFALKHDPKNMAAWLAEEKRRERWEARNKGARPPRLNVKFQLPSPHPLLDPLGQWEGILSDAASHCTPEYLAGYEWEQWGESLFLSYIVKDLDHILRTLRFATVVHLKILELFNETTKGVLGTNKDWCAAMEGIRAAGRAFPPPEHPETADSQG